MRTAIILSLLLTLVSAEVLAGTSSQKQGTLREVGVGPFAEAPASNENFNTVSLEDSPNRELFDLDGTLTVGGPATGSFDLPEFDDYDDDTTDATTRGFGFMSIVEGGTTVTCTMLTCSRSSGTVLGLRVGEGSDPNVAFDNGDDNLEISSICPFSSSYRFFTANSGFVLAASEYGPAFGVTIQCTSSASTPVPTPFPTPVPTPVPTQAPVAPPSTPTLAPIASPGSPTRPPSKDGTGSNRTILVLCFSEVTTMEVKDKGATLMKDLQINDQVFVGRHNHTNKPIYEPIYSFGHYEKETPHEFFQIHTPAQKEPLELSAAHLLYVEGKEHPVRADSIQTGDLLIQHEMDSPVTYIQVTKVTKVIRNGAYMPLTKSGRIVVNEILASSYVSLTDEAPAVVSKYLTLVSEDQLVHWWLAPYRMVCQSVPSLCEDDKDESGICYWLVFGRYLAKEANGWGCVLQILGLAVVWLFMAFWMGLEVIVGVFEKMPCILGTLFLAFAANNVIDCADKGTQKRN